MSVAGSDICHQPARGRVGQPASELGWLGAVVDWRVPGGGMMTGRFSDRVGRASWRSLVMIAASIGARLLDDYAISLLLSWSGLFGCGLACFGRALSPGSAKDLAATKLAARLTASAWRGNLGLLSGFVWIGILYKHESKAGILCVSRLHRIDRVLLIAGRDGPPGRPSGIGAPGGLRPTNRLPNSQRPRFRKRHARQLFDQLRPRRHERAVPQLATHLGIGADVHGALLAADAARRWRHLSRCNC